MPITLMNVRSILIVSTATHRETSYRYIHDYSYKPDPEFKGEGKRYFGVELEVDYGGNDNAKEVLDIANYDKENIYIKSDGSLDDGFEIVTHPMTLNYYINLMPWEEVMRKLIRMGYKSHKAGTCSLHIHINRTAFGYLMKFAICLFLCLMKNWKI